MKAWSRCYWQLLLCGVLAAAVIVAVREWRVLPDGKCHAYFLDIGQGDAALLVSPSGKQVVIDGGPDRSLLEHLGKRFSFFDRDIDALVLSHPHLDHLAAFPELAKRYRIRRAILTGAQNGLPAYNEMLGNLQAQDTIMHFADDRRDIDLGDGLVLDLLWPPRSLAGQKQDADAANNSSVTLRATCRNRSILFTGDMEEPQENAILSEGIDVRADILKVAHHGSKTSSSTGFLLAVQPDLAVISVGRVNTFGHPSPSVIDRFRTLRIPVRMTAKEGTVALEW